MGEPWFYYYTLEYWDEILERLAKDCGFVRAESFNDAVSQITGWYGEKYINKIKISTIQDGDGPLTLSRIKSNLKGKLNDED